MNDMEQHLLIYNVIPTPPSPLALEHSSSTSPLPSEPPAPPPPSPQTDCEEFLRHRRRTTRNSSITADGQRGIPPSPQTDYEEFLQTQVASVIDIFVEVAVEEMARRLEECLTSAIPLEFLQTEDLIQSAQMSKLQRQLIQMYKIKTEQFALFMKELGRASTEKMKMLMHTGVIQVGLNASKEKVGPEQVTRACDDGTNDNGDLSDPDEEEDQSPPGNFAPSDNGHPITKKMPEWETAALIPHTPNLEVLVYFEGELGAKEASQEETISLSEHNDGQEEGPNLQSASHAQPTLALPYTGDVAEENLAAQTADLGGAALGADDIVKSSTSDASHKETISLSEHNDGQEQGPDLQSASHAQPTLTLLYVGDVPEENLAAQTADLGGADSGNDAHKKWHCALCGERFDDKNKFLYHSYLHEDWYVCVRCGKGFDLKRKLADHRRPGKCYSCSHCGEFFRTELQLKRHLWTHTGLKPYTCQDCGTGYMHKKHLKIHTRSHVTCTYCKKSFLKSALGRHPCVDGELLISCQVCPATFNNDKDMFYHKHSHDPEDRLCLGDPKRPGKRVKVAWHLCDMCGLSFRDPLYFQSHVTVHTGEKLLGCEICGRKFRYHSNVLRHMANHTDPKKHLCETCGKRFTQAVVLKAHQLIHTKGRVCKLCGKKCKTLKLLNQHRRTSHSSSYSVSCEVCGKNFWRKAMLKYHMRLHTGESPNTCTESGKSFMLKFHMKSHKCLKSVT